MRAELSWTHYRLLISLDDENARKFYMKEAIENSWSTRQLEREINTFSYQRYIASGKNHDVVDDTAKREEGYNPTCIVKDLEGALITHLQEFLLELGSGFAFVARQKRFDMDGRNFYVDLVLYNYNIKCFVLIDLKSMHETQDTA